MPGSEREWLGPGFAAAARVLVKRSVCLALLFAARLAPAAAQSAIGSERQDFRRASGDIWAIWTSPARATRADIGSIAGGAALVGLTGIRDSAVWAWMNAHPTTLVMRSLRPIREDWRLPVYEFGSGQVLLPMSALLYASGRLSHSVALRDAGLGCAAGHLSSLGVRDLVYASVSRARPRITPDPYTVSFPGSRNWDWHSFLSGHISNSMACASFLGHRFGLGAAEPVPYVLSLAIGLGRMADGRHWASDTMTGAIVGFAIGKAIAARQLDRLGRTTAPGTAGAVVREGSSVPLVRVSFDF